VLATVSFAAVWQDMTAFQKTWLPLGTPEHVRWYLGEGHDLKAHLTWIGSNAHSSSFLILLSDVFKEIDSLSSPAVGRSLVSVTAQGGGLRTSPSHMGHIQFLPDFLALVLFVQIMLELSWDDDDVEDDDHMGAGEGVDGRDSEDAESLTCLLWLVAGIQ